MKLIKGALVAIVAVFAAAAVIGILFGTKQSPDAPDPAQTVAEEQTQEEPEAAEEVAQTFTADGVTVEYRGTQDAADNAVVTFAVTNGTSVAVNVRFDNVVVNDQFDIVAMGGNEVPIQPGHTGAASIAFGVSVQTTLGGVDELETLSADVTLVDAETFEDLVSVPVSVTL